MNSSPLLWLWIPLVFLALFLGVNRWWGNFFGPNQETSELIATSTEPVATAITHPDVRVISPKAGGVIRSPLKITGEARGTWFFEASFPVFLVDWDGLIIAEGVAQAEADWMTEDFVPFTAQLFFTKPAYGEGGALILKKDNPSGLPINDAAVEIPIKF